MEKLTQRGIVVEFQIAPWSVLTITPQSSSSRAPGFKPKLNSVAHATSLKETTMNSGLATRVVLIVSCFLSTIFAQPASAKIVYTPVNTTLTGSGHIKINLNHDGIKDFDIQSAVSEVACGFGHEIHGVVTVKPTPGDGVVASGPNATALASGIRVGPTGTFSNHQSLMTNFLVTRGCGHLPYRYGNWCSATSGFSCSRTGYLGLRFLVNGQTHYGWAYTTVMGGGSGLSVTLKSFAYETIAGRGITTGQTSGE